MQPSKSIRLSFVLLTCFVLIGAVRAQTEASSLKLGEPIERTIATGQTHSFGISLERNQYLKLVVDQRGVDVLVRVFAPDGKSLGEFDSPNGDTGPENVSVMARDSGVYRIDVVPFEAEKGANPVAGKYEIKILEVRPATKQELKAEHNKDSAKEKGLALLVEIADSLSQIRQPQIRVRDQVAAARLLWSYDEKTARKLLQDAMAGVKEYIGKADPGSDQNYYQVYQTSLQLRTDVVQALVAHDPETALSFLLSTAGLADPNAGPNSGRSNQDLQIELSIANQIALTDPKRALQIAEETLKKGYSNGLMETLAQLRRMDSESAVKLAEDMVSRLQAEDLLKNPEAANLTGYLLQVAQAPAPNGRGSRNAGPDIRVDTPLLSDQEYRDLFQKALSTALSYRPSKTNPNEYTPERNSAQNLMNALKSTPGISTYAPDSVSLVARRSDELNTNPSPQQRIWQKFQETMNTGTINDALEAVGHAPAQMRDNLYQQVAVKAADQGDFNLGSQILTDHVSNQIQRQQSLRYLEQRAIQYSVSKGKIDDALRSAGNLRTSRERAMMIAQIVGQIGSNGTSQDIINFLEQARGMLGDAAKAENQEQMNALIAVATAYARHDSKRAFDIVEPLIDQFNEMSNAAQALNGFGQEYFQDGELSMSNGNNVGQIANQLVNTLGSFAVADFDRAKIAAGNIQRPEVRLSAYFSIAQRAINQ